MSDEQFNKIVFGELAKSIYSIMREYDLYKYNNDGDHWELGVYIHTRCAKKCQVVNITFLNACGIYGSKDFLDYVSDKVDIACSDILSDKFFYHVVSQNVINWENSRCDMRSMCEQLYPDGLVIRSARTFETAVSAVTDSVAKRDQAYDTL